MKKNIFIALVAFVFTSLSAFAQSEKEYSMVINLQSGSTVTLGHNDVKNITFTGDNVAAEGNVVNSIEELQKAVTDTRAMVEASHKELSYLNEDTNAKLDYVKYTAQEQTEVAKKELQDNLDMTKAELLVKITELASQNDALQARMQLLNDLVTDLQHQINELKAGK